MANILHVLATGGIGGIEVLCKDIGEFSQHNNTFCFLWRGGLIEKEMCESGFQSYIIGIKKNDIFSYFKVFNQLSDYIRINSYDCIVFHHSAPLMWLFLPLLKHKFKKIFIVLYSHNNYDNLVKIGKHSMYIRQSLFKAAYKNADGVISISKSVKKSVIKQLPMNESKNVVIYNGVNTSSFHVADRSEINGKVKIVYVGRITKEKGVQVLVKALARIDEEKYIADIYGDGPYLNEIKRLVNVLELSNSIVLHGETREVGKCMAKADLFVHPAIWEEGFGISLVEAMASGLIVVASDVGAVPEIIKDSKNGFLFTKGNEYHLSCVLDSIISMDSLELNRIRRCSIDSAQEFSIQKMANEFDVFVQNGIEGVKND